MQCIERVFIIIITIIIIIIIIPSLQHCRGMSRADISLQILNL